jgi:hypothetical protein
VGSIRARLVWPATGKVEFSNRPDDDGGVSSVSDEAMRAVELTREEIEVYREFGDYYGYIFFVMRHQ